MAQIWAQKKISKMAQKAYFLKMRDKKIKLIKWREKNKVDKMAQKI